MRISVGNGIICGNRVDRLSSGKPAGAVPVPAIAGVRAPTGVQAQPPASISFFAIPQANNAACRSAS